MLLGLSKAPDRFSLSIAVFFIIVAFHAALMQNNGCQPISSNPILSNPISSNKNDICPISSKI